MGQTTETRAHGDRVDTGLIPNPHPIVTGMVKNIGVEFPTFNGGDPRGWVEKCQRFFNINPVLEQEKLMLASMHLEGKANNSMN